MTETPCADEDVRLAFDAAPVGLLVSRNRVIRSYNQAFRDMFGYTSTVLRGESLERLYPSTQEYRHVGERALAAMRERGLHADERIMRKADDRLFWCHVSGRALDRLAPFASTVWMFEELPARRPVEIALTPREREIAPLVILGRTSKQIARFLGVGHRTVEAHKARLMAKHQVSTTTELVARLLGQHSPSSSPPEQNRRLP